MSPVMYHLKDSIMAQNIRNMLNRAKAVKDNETVYRQLVLMKMYQGVNYLKDETGKYKRHRDYLYYDEREWRYIPNLPQYKDLICFVGDQTELDALKNDGLDDTTKPFMCTFTVYDVKYIIVEDDIDRILFSSAIDKMTNWNKEDKRLLKSKIITHELINNDL